MQASQSFLEDTVLCPCEPTPDYQHMQKTTEAVRAKEGDWTSWRTIRAIVPHRANTEDVFIETDVYMLKQRPYRASRASHEERWDSEYPSPKVLLVNSNDNERVTLAKKNLKADQLNRGESRNKTYANSELICSNTDKSGQWEKDGAVSDWMSKWRKKLILTLTSHRTQKSIPDGLQIYMWKVSFKALEQTRISLWPWSSQSFLSRT